MPAGKVGRGVLITLLFFSLRKKTNDNSKKKKDDDEEEEEEEEEEKGRPSFTSLLPHPPVEAGLLSGAIVL